MRTLAIDPGYERLGVAILTGARGSESLVHSGCIRTHARDTFPTRLAQIDAAMQDYIHEHRPDACAVETLVFGVNQKTAMLVAAARGVIVAAAAREDIPVYEYTPQDVKIAVTGHGASGKQQVTDMVKKLVADTPPNTLDDEYDAIAVGLTHLAHSPLSTH